MPEDFGDVTQVGEELGRSLHSSLKIKRCENGYIVEYSTESKQEQRDQYSPSTVQKTRVFLTNTDMLEFIEKYFQGEPKP